ncbi:MAG TPA: hypothetical protein VNZ22_12435, partial [Bacillota bacterium]|nr:hypothetical protein [Bacillota bacterium]
SLGRFAWTPSTAPSTNLIRIVVSDSGIPSLSTAQDFQVIVLPPPRLESFQLNGSQFLFRWQAPAGPTYQVEYKDDLAAPVWIALETPITGTGDSLTFTNDLGTSPQRFFRVRMLP